MAQRKSLKDDECPVARSADVMGDRWSLLIVRNAFDGVRRFSEFQRTLGVAKNILSDRLRKLVAEGVLQAEAASDGSQYQDYVLTPKGQDLFALIVAFRQWGERHLFAKGEVHSLLLDRNGQPLQTLEARAHNGRKLSAAHTVVQKVSPGKASH